MIARRQNGFTLVELMIVVAIIGVLAMMAIPNVHGLRTRAYEASARSTGRNAQSVEGIIKTQTGSYTGDLDDLLAIDKNLLDDTSVTFVFGSCDSSGYTFTMQHARSGSFSVVISQD